MAHLSLTGVSDDGRLLHLRDADGATHTLDVDDALRSAIAVPGAPTQPNRSSPTSRTSTREAPMTGSTDSALRPRDIQSRIRGGETAESVAAAAGTPVERIMAFVNPVLAERAHVAERAQRSTLRRRAGEGEAGGTRVLGDAVEARLRALDVDPEAVEWDAWRRTDGRWSLRASFASGARAGIAEFTYDMPGSFVTVDNEDGRWLIGDAPLTPPVEAPAADDLGAARARRLESVRTVGTVGTVGSSEEVPLGGEALGDDAIELVTDAAAPVTDPVIAPDGSVDVPFDLPATPATGADTAGTDTADTPDATAPGESPSEPPRRPVHKRKGRASVPSWDEIMFGGGDQ